MTLSELKIKIAKSANHEWFEGYTININYPQIGFKVTFNGVSSLYQFVLNQVEGFEKFSELPQELTKIKNAFIAARDNIISLIKSENFYVNNWNDNLRTITNNNPLFFLYDSPETEFLIKVNQETPKFYNGAYEYLTGSTQHASNKDYLAGYILAFEFTSKDFSLLAERKNSEKKSILNIRNDFQKILDKSELEMTSYLSQANQKYVDYSTKIDIFQIEKEKGFIGWFEATTVGYNKFYAESDKKIKDLEDLYREKLKLEAPAKYWSDRAKKLRSEGNNWLIALIVTVIVGIGLLTWSLSEISAGTLDKIFQNNGTAIKWSVVFITLISFIAFAIRIFSKLTFSSFHLVRDAEEREQLTYVYLALQKEKNIDETERHLIMQSLFSRADSGLLKDDAGPTMPGNIADKMISK